MAKTLDLRLYLVTDEDCLPAGVTLLDAVEQALQAGVTLVQYREKHGNGGKMLAQAKALTELCHRYGVPLVVDDRLDVALAAGADGVHLGQDDLPCAVAREPARTLSSACRPIRRKKPPKPRPTGRIIWGVAPCSRRGRKKASRRGESSTCVLSGRP